MIITRPIKEPVNAQKPLFKRFKYQRQAFTCLFKYLAVEAHFCAFRNFNVNYTRGICMAFYFNDLVQEACEDLSLTGIGEAVEGKLAAAAEGCVNRGIAQLNGDGYMSLTYHCHDINAPGKVFFRLLEDGEQKPSTINEAPPDSIENVARKVGIRYMRLRPTSRDQLDNTQTFSYPTAYTYGTETEIAPSGTPRRVGIIYTNGTYPTDFRIYVNS